jgi:hypothetical protein
VERVASGDISEKPVAGQDIEDEHILLAPLFVSLVA